mmetsp:Transcript_17238/g.42761  ORF Transcript_17238/g.42761 Transcript_17238/m.42761 type:complete len:239 (+) Transcript_17238:218-934(+)
MPWFCNRFYFHFHRNFDRALFGLVTTDVLYAELAIVFHLYLSSFCPASHATAPTTVIRFVLLLELLVRALALGAISRSPLAEVGVRFRHGLHLLAVLLRKPRPRAHLVLAASGDATGRVHLDVGRNGIHRTNTSETQLLEMGQCCCLLFVDVLELLQERLGSIYYLLRRGVIGTLLECRISRFRRRAPAETLRAREVLHESLRGRSASQRACSGGCACRCYLVRPSAGPPAHRRLFPL